MVVVVVSCGAWLSDVGLGVNCMVQVSSPEGEAAVLLDPSPATLLSCPHGFAAGLDLPIATSAPTTVNLASVLGPTDEVLALFREAPVTPTAPKREVGEVGELPHAPELAVVSISSGPRSAGWAEMLDSEGGVPNFHQQVRQGSSPSFPSSSSSCPSSSPSSSPSTPRCTRWPSSGPSS